MNNSIPFLRQKELTPEISQNNYICLTDQSLKNLRYDLERIESLSEKRLNEIIKEITNKQCETSVEDYSLFNKKLILIEMEFANKSGNCFDDNLINSLNNLIKNKLKEYSIPELDLLKRQITRNNVKCNSNKNLNKEILEILELEKEKRLWETVPKSIEERSRLDLLSEEENIKKELQNKKKELPNQTIAELSSAYSKNVTGLLNDILSMNENMTFSEHLIESFKKEDRILYFGGTIVVFSIFLMMIK